MAVEREETATATQRAPRNTILFGDALSVLRTLPDACVQMCVTSPPYYGLRSYNTEPVIWDGDPSCEHVCGATQRAPWANDLPEPHGRKKNVAATRERTKETGPFCQRCSAWRGELGQETDPDAFVRHLVQVFREVRRVLRPDGVLFVNLSDSYAGSWGNYAPGGIKGTQRTRHTGGERWERPAYGDTQFLPATAKVAGVKEKSLIGIPYRFALAMMVDGWILRSDVIWEKPNGMPSSVEDRPTLNHEHVFMFARTPRYFYDAQAIAEPVMKGAAGSTFTKGKTGVNGRGRVSLVPRENYATRNARSVWTLPTEPWAGSHYAVMPSTLAARCVLAGSAPRCCEWCDAPWERVVQRTPMVKRAGLKAGAYGSRTTDGISGTMLAPAQATTVGWRPMCRCAESRGVGRCLVLDPFMGAGTTAIAAQRNDRDWLGIELNPTFREMALTRILAAGNSHVPSVTRASGPIQTRALWEVAE